MSTGYRVILFSAGAEPDRVIARLRDFTGFSLPKALWFVENLPLPVVDGLGDEDEAKRLKERLETVGAKVGIEPSRSKNPMMVWNSAFDNLAFVLNQFPPRPHSFNWILDDQLAGMGRPYGSAETDYLKAVGVDLLVSLTESPLAPDILKSVGCRSIHVPIPDLAKPSEDQIDTVVREIDKTLRSGGKAVVHCGAGMGRTGVLLACYLVFAGKPAEEAIAEVRSRRHGSIETPEQEQCVRDYAERLRSSKR
jgi:atypical dual specificity phosphatase